MVRGKVVDDNCISYLERLPTIMPSSKFKICWDSLLIITLITTLWMYPIDIIMGREDM